MGFAMFLGSQSLVERILLGGWVLEAPSTIEKLDICSAYHDQNHHPRQIQRLHDLHSH